MDEGSSGGSPDPSGGNAFNRSSPNQPGQASPNDILSGLLDRSGAYDKINFKSGDMAQRMKETANRANLARQSTRNWKSGDIYAPHDLSPQEMVKWKAPKQPKKDIIDMLGLNPLDHYRVCCCLAWVLRLVYVGQLHREVDGFEPAGLAWNNFSCRFL